MPSVLAIYRWELRKLRAQKRTYLGLGAAAVIPLIFVVALVTQGGKPEDIAFGRYVHQTGLAIPLVLLLFGSIWMFPLITALVLSVTVFWSVAVPVPIVGRAKVPVGGVIPISASKVLVGAFVTCCPTSHSPLLSARPVVAVPL